MMKNDQKKFGDVPPCGHALLWIRRCLQTDTVYHRASAQKKLPQKLEQKTQQKHTQKIKSFSFQQHLSYQFNQKSDKLFI